MPKFACTCGHIISFITIPCRYDGDVIREHGSEEYYERLTQELAAFTAAVASGRRDEWIRQKCGDGYPLDLSDDSVISDLISAHESRYVLNIHQCERCGRLWLQDPRRENRYTGFVPEGAWRGALEVPAEGFIGYVEGQDLFRGTIQSVERAGSSARVCIEMPDGGARAVAFEGVTSVEWHHERPGSVRYLGEWAAPAPCRRFVLDGDGPTDPLVEVIAEGVGFL